MLIKHSVFISSLFFYNVTSFGLFTAHTEKVPLVRLLLFLT